MPFMFIHGVNIRDKKATINDAGVLGDELARHVVGPLARELARWKVGRLDQIRIAPAPLMFVPFWGDVGVQFRWNLKSLPKVRVIGMGSKDTPPGEPLPGQAEILAELLTSNGLTPDAAHPLLQAARADLERFLSVIFAPTIYQGEPLLEEEANDLPDHPSAEEVAQNAGARGEALLTDTLHELARQDPVAREAVEQAADDHELLSRLQELLLARLQERIEPKAIPPQAAPAFGGVALGADQQTWGELFGNIKDRTLEFFGRVKHAPSRAASVTTLRFKREQWNDDLTRFTGDVFEYLHHRDVGGKPGPIIQRVLAEIDAAHAAGHNDPWFVVTHSMGGNIFYDVITHYRPKLDVEVWLSVGGQVGLFEEMKLFHQSDSNLYYPLHVAPPWANVGCWLNIYDPADPFAYLAKPVFEGTVAADIKFNTGTGGTSTHSAYFKQRSFFDKIQAGLRAAYEAKAAAAKSGTPEP